MFQHYVPPLDEDFENIDEGPNTPRFYEEDRKEALNNDEIPISEMIVSLYEDLSIKINKEIFKN